MRIVCGKCDGTRPSLPLLPPLPLLLPLLLPLRLPLLRGCCCRRCPEGGGGGRTADVVFWPNLLR
jgi:hypothetical protein